MVSPYEARAPAFGVRATIKGNTVRVHAVDSGGRGSPHAVIILPVKEQGEHLRMIDRLGNCLEPTDGASLKRANVFLEPNPRTPQSKKQTLSPYLFKVPRDEWPHWASRVLVLLLYVQSLGIGGQPRPPRKRRDNEADAAKSPIRHKGEDAENEAAEAIGEALTCDKADKLRGGLIDGRLDGLVAGRRSASAPSEPPPTTFALASCQYPSDILDRMPDDEHATRGPADASLLALGDLLGNSNAPTLLLLAGDQVYTDATAGLFDPKVLDERFRIPHEHRAQSRGAKAVMQRLDLTVEMMLDDHEIRDNWAPNDPEPQKPESGNTAIEQGKAAYFKYERALQQAPPHVWRYFDHRGLSFFLGDTRTERDGRTALNWSRARIMGRQQCLALCRWLIAPERQTLPKFVLTGSALLPRRLATTEHPACALHSDAWDGYPSSLQSILKFACDREIKGLVFLSGDEHLSNVVTARVSRSGTNRQCTLYSIHSSSLYAPYPFANAVAEDFAGEEIFFFPDPRNGPYRCEVRTEFAPGDGFALATGYHDVSGWRLDVKFHNADGIKKDGAFTLVLS